MTKKSQNQFLRFRCGKGRNDPPFSAIEQKPTLLSRTQNATCKNPAETHTKTKSVATAERRDTSRKTVGGRTSRKEVRKVTVKEVRKKGKDARARGAEEE